MATTVANCWAAGGTVIAWGKNDVGETNVPPGLSNVVAIAAGDYHSLALRSDGTVVAWGLNAYGATNVPPDLTNAVAIGGGLWHSLALRSDGTLEGWGANSYSLATPPSGLSNVVAIACGMWHNLAVKNDGTVVAWGDPSYGCTTVPPGLSNVVAVAAGYYLSLALKSDGTVVAWGDDFSTMAEVPPGLTNVQAISSESFHSLALNKDGTVASWGILTNVPIGLTNAIAVAAGGYFTGVEHSLALKNDGTLVAWGTNGHGEGAVPPGLPNVAAIAAGSEHNLVLVDNPSPHFSLQPVGQTVYSGTDVTLRSIAFGPGPLAYQWCLNGTNLTGATGNFLVLPNAQPGNSGNYTVVVTNSFGATTSFVASVAVVPSPPLLNLVSSNNITLTAGDSTTFVAEAVGSLPLSLQWQLNGNSVSGADQPSLTISNAAPSDSGVYTLFVTNQYGSTSTNLTLNVYDLTAALNDSNLTWTTSGTTLWNAELTSTHDGIAAAQSESIDTGSTSVLETTVNGPGTLTFWWAYSPGDLVSGDRLNFVVNGTTIFWLGQPTGWQQQTVYLGPGPQTLQWDRTKNSAQYVQSSAELDEVNYAPGPTAPVVSAPPANVSVAAGSTATFSAGAEGTPPLAYQWQYGGTNIFGATSNTLRIVDAQSANAGQYSIVVTNAYGSASSNCLLTVTPATPKVTVSPSGQSIIINATATFSANAVGSEPFTFQWKFQGTNIDGATLATLTLAHVQATNSGNYSVVVSNAYGGVSSPNAGLTVVSPAMVIGWGSDNNGEINFPATLTNPAAIAAGYYHTLVLKNDHTVAAFGANNYGQSQVPPGLTNAVAVSAGSYQSMALRSDGTIVNWGYNWAPPPTGFNDVAAIACGGQQNLLLRSNGTVVTWGLNNTGQLNVPNGLTDIVAIACGGNHSLVLDASGHVFAWGDNSHGQSSVPPGLSNVVAVAAGFAHSLALGADGTITAWGDNTSQQTSVPPGLSNVVAISAGLTYSLALRADGTTIAWGTTASGVVSGATNVTQAVAIAAGGYHGVAILNDGSPFILGQPISRSVLAGDTVIFRLVAMGQSPLTYQWQFNGSDVNGATNSVLIITNAPTTSAGVYLCQVTNSLGLQVSQPATLAVSRLMPQLGNWSASGPGSTGFSLQLSGLSGHGDIVLYASTNLTDWEPVITNSPVVGTLMLLDSAATNIPVRFYRAVEQ